MWLLPLPMIFATAPHPLRDGLPMSTGVNSPNCRPASSGAPRFVLVARRMTRRRHSDDPENAPTMHRWTAKHYVLTAVIILLAMGMFAYSWS